MTAADVSIVTETLPGSQVGLTIEVPSEQVDRAYERVLNRLSQRVRIEGFRPGKAPRPLVEARLGPAAIRDEVVDALIQPVVSQALRDHEIEAIDRPRVEIQELERGRPARFTARVSVMPEVILPDLDALRVERQQTVVDDEMVERRLGELLERLAQVEPVDREARPGDIVVADLKVIVDGREVPSEARQATEVEVSEEAIIPELFSVLPGRRAGEVASAEVTLPEEHPRPELRGVPARIEVTVHGVKEKRVPELTDEVAPELSGGEHQTADALRDAVRQELVDGARRLDELAFEQAAVRAVTEATRLELPATLVEREMEREREEQQRTLQRRGLRLDRYLEYVGKTAADHQAELQADAEGRIRVDLVLEELGRRLEIEPSDDEVRQYMRSEMQEDDQARPRLDSLLQDPVAIHYFRHRLTRLRVLEGLVARLGGGPAAAGADQPGGIKAE